ncbi:DUF7289 family protein [Halomicrococcus sp. SG-WS-1]|uniref:DUF7289 family protein n=1 Tax=Halomicrococcus sp. SG-WS-1 TaxID=3439057 RepID=UPI003F7A05AA
MTGSSRAQSETLGVVLLLGLTIVGTGLIVAFGSSSLDDSKRATDLDGAAQAMAQLDSKASRVGIGSANAQHATLSVDGDEETVRRTDGGWMRVHINRTNGSDAVVMNQTLGAVVYENGDTTIAYQGGGVWRRTDGGATMVSPPEVHYRDTTLTLPLVVVGGEGRLDGGHLELTKNGTAEPKYPVANASKRNPLSDATVNVTVASDYYRAWGQFFEQRTGGDVEYDHDAGTVTLTLVTPTKAPKIEQGLASTSPQELLIEGAGGSSFTDSYNSSKGPYSVTNGTNGTVRTVGSVSLSGGAEIQGDLVTGGGVVKMKNNEVITGNLSYGGTKSLKKHSTVGGWIANNGSVAKIDPVGTMIDREVSSLSSDNDNNETAAIDGNRLDSTNQTWNLTSGDYYLEDLDVDSDETLVLNLSDGNVDLAVDGDVSLSGGEVVVQDPANGTANVYTTGSSLSVTSGGTVSVPDDRSRAFRLYGQPGTDATFSGEDTEFTGVLYAPDSASQHGTVSVTSHADVYGALVGGRTTLKSGGTVHYDQALVSTHPLPASYTTTPRVTYMHVSVHRVNVTSA